MSQQANGGPPTPLTPTMRDLLESGRIGRPVFVRWTETLAGPADAFRAAASSAVDALSAWFDAGPEHTHELGSAEMGNLAVMARWPGDQTAIVALGPASRDSKPSIDLAVIGSEGAAYHRGPMGMIGANDGPHHAGPTAGTP